MVVWQSTVAAVYKVSIHPLEQVVRLALGSPCALEVYE